MIDGAFAPCAKSPNCVSSQANQRGKQISPMVYLSSIEEAKSLLKSVISDIKRAKLITEEASYLHYEFTTAIGAFIDDVEFYFPSEEKVIHMKSSSREGWWDLGANRRRLKRVKRKFRRTPSSQSSKIS